MKRKLTVFTILSSLFVFVSFISKSDDPRIAKIMNKVSSFTEKYNQQKIHIHTDKDVYKVGETVWMKAYLLKATSMLPDTTSKEIYVDLLDMYNRPCKHLILKNYRGFSVGDLALSDSLMEGNYQLRAYSGWMRNFDPDFFFYKTISVKNPNYENVVSKSKLKEIKQLNSNWKIKESETSITFFPEGGSLIAGLPANVAFKAENGWGNAIALKGVILDNKGNQVVSFETSHEGMGVFKFTPQPGTLYKAQITLDNGEIEKVALPEPLPTGVALTVDPSTLSNIRILIQSNKPQADDASNEIIIVGQSRGVVTYVSKGIVKDKLLSVIPKKVFPSGVAQITLFDYRGEPICERLVFIDHLKDQASQVKLTNINSTDSMFLNIKLMQNTPATGNFSVSVIDKVMNPASSSINILTNLLLTADLKGRINNPLYYFDKNNTDASKHLDLVMMTNGWRRFVWKEVMGDKYHPLVYPSDGGLSIKGRLVSNSSEPFYNSKVVFSFPENNSYKIETSPDSKGMFELRIMDFEDTVKAKVSTYKTNSGKADGILIDDDATIVTPGKSFPTYVKEQYDKDKISINSRKENAESKKRNKGRSEDEDISRPYGAPSSYLIIGEDANNYSSVLQYMQGRLSGVDVVGSDVVIRGVKTLLGSSQPLFILDGATVDLNTVLALSPLALERIDVLKGPDASVYGSRGANGVILFYTKRTRLPKSGSIEFNMVGYHKIREFYIPPYDSWTYKPSDYQIPRTIYWNPFVVTNASGEASLRFKKKSPAEKYTIVLEGMTDSGEILTSVIQN